MIMVKESWRQVEPLVHDSLTMMVIKNHNLPKGGHQP